MLTHEDLVQGTPQWDAHRAIHRNASDAPAMMGCSPYKTRSELLHECWLHLQGLDTGKTVDAGTQRRFDNGHRFEALCRPLAEVVIGESLYPVVGSKGKRSASFDGLTMSEQINWEHKTLNAELRSVMVDGCSAADLPLMYRVQVEQQHEISDAEKTLFSASQWDGDNLVEVRHCWIEPDFELRAKIIAGWDQFERDLAAYVPAEVIVPAVAAPQIGLPAVSIQVTGSIALVDNLEKFGTALTAYIERINKKPETDQDFADLEATVKTLKTAEDALDSAEANALAQTDSIDNMRRTVGLYRDTARTNRLLIEKLVKAEKENRRIKIVSDAVAELHSHISALNGRARNNMPPITNQFQEVIKGLKSIDSMRDKVAGELARCKIESNAIADRIQYHLELLDDEVEFGFLFPDSRQIVLKASDDFKALVASRIAAHKVAEAAKQAAIIARIEAEAKEKAEREARAKVAAEQAEAAAKLAAEKAAELKPAPAPAQTFVMHGTLPTTLEQFNKTYPLPVKKSVVAAPTMPLGEISSRLGFNVTSVFLASLGFEATTVKAAKLFQEGDFPAICRAIIEHITEVSEQFDAVSA